MSDTYTTVAMAIVVVISIAVCVVTVKDYRHRRKLIEKALDEINKPKLKV